MRAVALEKFRTDCMKCFTIFMTGGLVYYFIEIAVRHYSHYSMIICGGLATVLCGGLNQTFKRMGLLMQMLLSAVIISELEFITGYIFNIKLGCHVWSYAKLPYNLMGQICLGYSLIWMLMSLAIIYVDDCIRSNLFGERRPRYRLLSGAENVDS